MLYNISFYIYIFCYDELNIEVSWPAFRTNTTTTTTNPTYGVLKLPRTVNCGLTVQRVTSDLTTCGPVQDLLAQGILRKRFTIRVSVDWVVALARFRLTKGFPALPSWRQETRVSPSLPAQVQNYHCVVMDDSELCFPHIGMVHDFCWKKSSGFYWSGFSWSLEPGWCTLEVAMFLESTESEHDSRWNQFNQN